MKTKVNIIDGFTVLELAMVTAFLGLLTALVLLNVSDVQKRARGVTCQNRLRQIGNGLQMYVSDYKYYPPLTDPNTNIVCFEGLYPYYPLYWTNRMWNCPIYVIKKAILSQELVKNHSIGISYAYNYMGISSWPGCPETVRALHLGLGHLQANSQKEAAIAVPSEMYAVADARCEESGKEIAGCIKMSLWSLNYKEAPPFHITGYNTVFCDGHVSFLKREDLLYPPRSASSWNRDHQPHSEGWAPLTMWTIEK